MDAKGLSKHQLEMLLKALNPLKQNAIKALNPLKTDCSSSGCQNRRLITVDAKGLRQTPTGNVIESIEPPKTECNKSTEPSENRL